MSLIETFKLKLHTINHLAGLTMTEQFCTAKLHEFEQFVLQKRDSMLPFCVLHLAFSVVATLGNLLVIRALFNASSIPATVKKLFLSLAFSDLAVGLFPQLMSGVISAVVLKMASSEENTFTSFCPTVLTVYYYLLFLLGAASFLTVTAIAVDRLLAVSLHLRYQELVTSKRVITILVFLWLTSCITAFIYVFLPKGSETVSGVISFAGHILTTVAYVRVYKIAKSHQNQINSQNQLQIAETVEIIRQKKSAYNALFFYAVYLACYLPYLPSAILYLLNRSNISFFVPKWASIFLLFLNSSLNPYVYCWRYREIREIVKSTIKKLFRMK